MKKLLFILFLIGLPFMQACGSPDDSISYNQVNSHSQTVSVSASYDTAAKGSIQISVLGFVANPGVYIMPAGSRVYEAINAAGGISEGGDINSVDLVNIIKDGGRIYVAGSISDDSNCLPGGSAASGKMVNINLAKVSDFCTLPGIGESKASMIISYREKYGPFETIEDIMKVSGIKNGTFEKIKDYITVY